MDLDTLKTVSAGIAALIGAAIGASTTIFLQRRSMRLEREKLVHASRGRVNALSVAVFRDFLKACKDAERLAERREAGEIIEDDIVYQATAQMWLRYQEAEVFCDDSIKTASRKLVDTLQLLVWHPQRESVSSALNGPRADLFAVAGPIFREASG